MHLQGAIGRLWTKDAWRSAAEVDADIRDEFEFHIAMRTEDNLSQGMSPDEARSEAEAKFGDFESSRNACRKIDLGPRLLMQKLQVALLVALAAAVAYQAVENVRLRARAADEIASLTRTVEQLRSSGRHLAIGERAAAGGFSAVDGQETASAASLHVPLPDDWGRERRSLAEPWCDWGKLSSE